MTTRTVLAAGAALALAFGPLAASAQVGVNADASATVRVRGGLSSSTTVAAKIDARIATAKERADKEIDRRITKLNDLSAKINGMVHITSDQKTSLTATITGQISDLTTLKGQIDAETGTTTLKADIQSITKSYRIFALILPEVSIMAAADRALTVDSLMADFATKLSERISTASTSEQAAWQAALSDYNAKVADAKTQAQAAIDGVSGLKPDNGDQTVMQSNLAALKAARAKVQAAQQDLVAARKDAGKIAKGVAGLEASMHASASASTSAETH